jgi:uncharacterized protein (TIGR03435 family)
MARSKFALSRRNNGGTVKILNAFLFGAMAIVLAGAQDSRLVFEVASIKRTGILSQSELEGAKQRARMDSVSITQGSLTMRNITLKECIAWAYQVNKGYQISAGPGWIDSDRYDILARTPGPASEDQLRSMLQSLLADRFKLTLRRDKKELSVHALVIGKKGTQMRTSAEKGSSTIAFSRSRSGGLALAAQHALVSDLATVLTTLLQTPVVDMTGLGDRFDFTLDLASLEQGDKKNGITASLPDVLMAALQDQLGLKLESRKTPVDVLVIDAAERPSEN